MNNIPKYIKNLCGETLLFNNNIQNMLTHNFIEYDECDIGLNRFICTKCSMTALDIFWNGVDDDCIDLTKVYQLTCNEAIIKGIIE